MWGAWWVRAVLTLQVRSRGLRAVSLAPSAWALEAPKGPQGYHWLTPVHLSQGLYYWTSCCPDLWTLPDA